MLRNKLVTSGVIWLLAIFGAILSPAPYARCETRKADQEAWMVHPDYDRYRPQTVAVLPMDNLSLEPEVEAHLYQEVYQRLTAKGYSKIHVDKVNEVMTRLGIQTPGQLAGISLQRLGKLLNAQAVLKGRIDQSAAIHSGAYDAVVVSCSLELYDSRSGLLLWQTEQWRTAHRQWQLDPFNMLINFFAHENASRQKRIAYLVHEMFKTLPQGPVQIEFGNLLDQAKEITATE